MNNSIPLWNKESKKGTTYASGKTTIEGKQYRITLFVNNNKKTEKSPDYSLIIEEQQVSQEKPTNEPKNSSDDVFKEFGDLTENITDMDLPF